MSASKQSKQKPNGNGIDQLRQEIVAAEKELSEKGQFTPEVQQAFQHLMGRLENRQSK